ncbi:MAG: hypothetical protein AAGI88_19255 [Pseudomonadota bacterium]
MLRSRYPSDAVAELEMLQTDIMRFMAIIAICLLAVFSAVGALQPQDAHQIADVTEPVRDTPAALADVVSARGAKARGEPAAQPSVPSRSPQRLKPTQPSDDRRYEPFPVPELPIAKDSPSKLSPAVVKQDSSATAIEPSIKAAPRHAEAPAAEPSTAAPPREPVGFSLRFESDRAFLQLLYGGAIRLQLKSESRAWHWRDRTFIAGITEGDFYQLQQQTVPALLQARAQIIAGAHPQEWLVSLPVATRNQLDQLMRTHHSGLLQIDARGRVSLQPNLLQ